MSREQKLVALIKFDEQFLPRWTDSFNNRRDKVHLGSILLSMSNYWRAKAMYAWFVQGDTNAFRQHCYLASKLTLASVGESGGATFELSGDIMFALLSDNSEVVKSMSEVETPQLKEERNNPESIRSLFYMLQLAIRGSDEKLEEMIDSIAKKGKRHAREEASAGKDFFSLLLKRDQSGLEDLIQKHARMKNHDVITDGFMAYLGTVEAKLCWYKKIPVKIESPMIPAELMPVVPLDNYDDVYEFLKPGWIPPQQGLIGKISRWFT
ncbi:hypothetical protein JOD97_000002 [Duganella sp. 1411]|uniref:Imm49 family immunity protein n=1 Tax=Duganella sp. 1411 TaxID=2806572 RepID=UPI001AE333EE|nr:Imm49 family immunity protein [Duganella sp. 1411]MBP1201988.1 hypothetical protein [Duganella sp. 1411]